jgi:methyl-accepting chemotaxis protein
MGLFQRKRLFVDARVQGALFIRIVVYWFSGLAVIGELALYWHDLLHPGRPFFDQFDFSILFQEYAPVVVASLFILSLVLYDTLVLTNRFAGPILRLRRSMRALAAGEAVQPLRFRKRDFWQGIAQEFNAIVQQQEQMKKQLASAGVLQESENHDRCQLENTAVY